MRKRISKQKAATPVEQRVLSRQVRAEDTPSPLQTVRLLLRKTECLQNSLKFEKERIERIIAGRSLESIKFQQVEKNCSFEEFMKGYASFEEIRAAFTGLIQQNCLPRGLTFVDFKLKNFIIMNNYAHQLRGLHAKDKSETKLTASKSTTRAPHFKQLEIEVKRITKRTSARQPPLSASRSFLNLLSKNIERMRRNHRDPAPKTAAERDFKPILGGKAFLEAEDISAQLERLHTTPEEGFDAYGLEQFKDKNLRKLQQISQLSRPHRQNLPRSKLITEKSQDTLRYQTEYDTEKIQTRRSKSKKNVISFKKSTSRNKVTSKAKSPPLLAALQKQKK